MKTAYSDITCNIEYRSSRHSVELATICGLVNVGFGFGFKVDAGEGIILVIFSGRVDTRFGMEDFALDAVIFVDFVVITGMFPIVEADPSININHGYGLSKLCVLHNR